MAPAMLMPRVRVNAIALRGTWFSMMCSWVSAHGDLKACRAGTACSRTWVAATAIRVQESWFAGAGSRLARDQHDRAVARFVVGSAAVEAERLCVRAEAHLLELPALPVERDVVQHHAIV